MDILIKIFPYVFLVALAVVLMSLMLIIRQTTKRKITEYLERTKDQDEE